MDEETKNDFPKTHNLLDEKGFNYENKEDLAAFFGDGHIITLWCDPG